MVGFDRKTKREDDEKRYEEIVKAREAFLKKFHVKSSVHDAQEQLMKNIQVN